MESMENNNNNNNERESSNSSAQKHAKGSVRHIEKRREGTCSFADNVAKVSLAEYRNRVSQGHESRHNTCIATIVAKYPRETKSDILEVFRVIGLGVGTKFLKCQLLMQEVSEEGEYGNQIRDCHAEVLARRAFQRYLWLEIEYQLSNINEIDESYILKKISSEKGTRFKLRSDVTLHFYSSSAPCGNATVKKFAEMKKEKFNKAFKELEWPTKSHERIGHHSVKLGQFALLLKRDESVVNRCRSSFPKKFPGFQEPSGTSLINGLMHSCSDKLSRWNCLGLQGSLLSDFIVEPIYMTSLTCGRKFTNSVCRRAVCCRAWGFNDRSQANAYHLNHPSIMGTGIYVDEKGLVEMSSASYGQNANFNHHCWIYCAGINRESELECIDGNNGLSLLNYDDSLQELEVRPILQRSKFCTHSFVKKYVFVKSKLDSTFQSPVSNEITLEILMNLKEGICSGYRDARQEFLRHKVFREWNCRW